MAIMEQVKSPDEIIQEQIKSASNRRNSTRTIFLLDEINKFIVGTGYIKKEDIELNKIFMGVFHSIIDSAKRNHFLVRLLECLKQGNDVEDSLMIIAISNHYNK